MENLVTRRKTNVDVVEYVQRVLERADCVDGYALFEHLWHHLPNMVCGVVRFASPYVTDPSGTSRALADTCLLNAGAVFQRGVLSDCSDPMLRAGVSQLVKPLMQLQDMQIRVGDTPWDPGKGLALLTIIEAASEGIEITQHHVDAAYSRERVIRGIEKALYGPFFANRLGATLTQLIDTDEQAGAVQ